MKFYGAYQTWCKDTEVQLLSWARPEWVNADGSLFKPPTASWPLVDFESAFTISLGFLAMVFFGRIIFGFSFVPALVVSAKSKADAKKANPLVKLVRSLVAALRFLYNPVQMMLCGYMSLEALALAYRNGYSLTPCNAFNVENPPLGNLLWLFYLSKILDFVDTFLIIVGKKWKQLSFLHVYHHFSIFLFYWLNVNVAYDGDIYFTILLNGFIHFVMYTYYFVSSHPMEGKVWWRQYVTTFQLIQFVCMLSQAGYMMKTGCTSFPPKVTEAYFAYIMTMFALFSHFFVNNYILVGGKRKK